MPQEHLAQVPRVGKSARPRVVVGDISENLMNPKAWRLSNHVPHPGLPESLINPKKRGTQSDTPLRRMLEPSIIDVNGEPGRGWAG